MSNVAKNVLIFGNSKIQANTKKNHLNYTQKNSNDEKSFKRIMSKKNTQSKKDSQDIVRKENKTSDSSNENNNVNSKKNNDLNMDKLNKKESQVTEEVNVANMENLDAQNIADLLNNIIKFLELDMDEINHEFSEKLIGNIEELKSLLEGIDLSNFNSMEKLQISSLFEELQLSVDIGKDSVLPMEVDKENLDKKVSDLLTNFRNELNSNDNSINAENTITALSQSTNSDNSNQGSNNNSNSEKSNQESSVNEQTTDNINNTSEKGLFTKEFSIIDNRKTQNQFNDIQNNQIIDATSFSGKLENLNDFQLESMTKSLTQNNQTSFNNIMNQVIESAHVSLDENISEMLIKLKPESLGDLSMKIVIERGMVIAKFDVESQIVKQALESNLEDLRTALDDKGLQVQEFSVSVNQHSKQNQNSHFFNKKNKNKRYNIPFSEEGVADNMYISNTSQNIGINSTVSFLA